MLYYVEKGEGAPLVLLHGNGESHEIFGAQIQDFARVRRVIAPDTPGHGRSPKGEGPFTLRRFAGDLAAFLDGLGIEKADILGFSDGGNIALLFALRYPYRVRKLILAGANLNPFGMTPGCLFEVARHWARDAVCSPFSEKARHSRRLQALMLFQPRIPARALRRVAAPALVIAGTRDLIRERHTRRIARALPNGRLCLLEGSHFVLGENPAAFNRAVLEFLSEDETQVTYNRAYNENKW